MTVNYENAFNLICNAYPSCNDERAHELTRILIKEMQEKDESAERILLTW